MLSVSTAPIATPRLILWPVHPTHAAALWPILSNPALHTWIAREPLRTLSDVERRLARIAQRTAPNRVDQWLNWTVWRRDTGEAIGIVENTVAPAQTVQVAYLFSPSIWRQGYASEAMHAVLDAMQNAGATACDATIDTRNAASRALAPKLGFRLIETRASDDIIAGAPSMEELWRRDLG